MLGRLLTIGGAIALLAFAVTQWLHVGNVNVRVYVPNSPLITAIDDRLSGRDKADVKITPMRLRIPAIGLDAAVEELGVDDQGQLQTPVRWEDVGWYVVGPYPGEAGSAALAGHVDSHLGPAVFYRLHELKAGDGIDLDGPRGPVSFLVTGVRSYAETAVPVDELITFGGEPRLALLTCSGDYNKQTQRYNDRLVVTARRTKA